MSSTSTLQRQHDALERLSAELMAAISDIETREQAQSCARILGKMTGILTLHLAAEDKSLYPRMMASKDKRASSMAKCFADEMGGLAATYTEFEAKWRSGDAIFQALEDFRTEAALVLHALARRISRENEELYPLADEIWMTGHRDAA